MPSGPSLFIVDDDVGFVHAAAELARQRGFEITVAGTKAQAITRLAECTFDVAVIDVSLPDGSGLDLLEHLDLGCRTQAILINVYEELGLDPEKDSPGRQVVAHQGRSLVEAIKMARANAEPDAAQLVAAECVVLAETKDHMNWELIGHLAKEAKSGSTQVLKQAYEAVEQQEDHHLYHTTGWTRELWIKALGMPAVLPPPEEVKNVETAIAASRAEQARDQML